jgi:hypothetical protein
MVTAGAPELHQAEHSQGKLKQQQLRKGPRPAGQVSRLTLEPHVGSGGGSARVLNLTGQVPGSDAAASLVWRPGICGPPIPCPPIPGRHDEPGWIQAEHVGAC